jgi:hypothetical protein
MLSWLRHRIRRPEPTSAEREAVRDVLRDSGLHEASETVDAVVYAARDGSMKRIRAALGNVGIKLSAAPPMAYELVRRFSILAPAS